MSQSSTRLETRLKEREDEYTSYKQFHVFVGTFNVNNRQAPHERALDDWFRLHATSDGDEKQTVSVPDILAVGFQEIDTSGGAYLYDDKKKEDEWEQLVNKAIHSAFASGSEKDVQFELLNRVRLIGKRRPSNGSRDNPALLHFQGFYSLSTCVTSTCLNVRSNRVRRFPLASWALQETRAAWAFGFVSMKQTCVLSMRISHRATAKRNDATRTIKQ